MPFKKGQSGNPYGRPKSARQKLSESFVKDLQQQWKEHGKEVIRRVIESQPEKFLDAITKVIPKHVEAEITHAYRAADLNDDDLADIIGRSSRGATDTQKGETKLH